MKISNIFKPMVKTKKAMISFTCEPELKDCLTRWAVSESRTLSNLVEMVMREAYEIHQKRSNSSDRTNGSPTETTPSSATKAFGGKRSKEAS